MRVEARRVRFAGTGPNYPVLLAAAFVIVSLGLYWVRFPVNRDAFVLSYVLTCVLALLLGNSAGCRAKSLHRTPAAVRANWLWLACAILCLVVTVNLSVYYSSLSELGQYILEPGAAYERVKYMGRTDQLNAGVLGGSFGPVISLLSFTKYVVFGWAALYWGRFSRSLRTVCAISMTYYALHALLIGAMVNVGTVVLSTLVILLAKNRANGEGGLQLPWRVAGLGGLGLLALSYFLGSRQLYTVGFWDRIKAGADGLIFYVSHGYVGLGYALHQPFEFTWGQTALYGFTRLFSDAVPAGSYPATTEAETGWSATQLWSTAVPWLASDLTFWGVPLLLVGLGVWAGRIWVECSTTRDPFAMLLLGQLTVGLFFFPANNHLLQTFANASGFLIIAVAYSLRVGRARHARLPAGVPRRAKNQELEVTS